MQSQKGNHVKTTIITLAVAVAAIWGFNFVAIRWGLDDYPPILLACLRFMVAALPALSSTWLLVISKRGETVKPVP